MIIRFILIFLLSSCSAQRQPTFKEFISERHPLSELDNQVLYLANKDFYNLSAMQNEFLVEFHKFSNEVSGLYVAKDDSFPKGNSLFSWITYEIINDGYEVVLGLSAQSCFTSSNLYAVFNSEGINASIQWYLPDNNQLLYIGNEFEESHRNKRSIITAEIFKLSEDSYFEYQSESILRTNGTEESCIRRVKIIKKIKKRGRSVKIKF